MKKEYKLKINGLEESIKNVQSLADALDELDKSQKNVKKGLTEEEKAAKRLADTYKRTEEAQKGLTDEQVRANKALREAKREQELRIQSEQVAANSIEGLRIQLAQLKKEWATVDVASEEFENLTAKVRQVTDELKEAESASGDFRRNVGNYSDALNGLQDFSDKADKVSKSGLGLAQAFLSVNAVMTIFGDTSEENAKQAQQLQRIIAALGLVQQINANLIKTGVVEEKAAIVVGKVRTLQLKAKARAEALSTKSTIAATIAQKAFNLVASANPYILLALALVGVGAALFSFIKKTEDAADKQRELNELQKIHAETVERQSEALRNEREERISSLDREVRKLKASGASLDEIHRKEKQILEERKKKVSFFEGFFDVSPQTMEAHRKNLREAQVFLDRAREAKARGDDKVLIQLEIDGRDFKRIDVEKAIEIMQYQVDTLNKKIEIGTKLVLEKEELGVDAAELEKRQEEERKAEQEEAKRKAQAAAEEAKKRKETEISALRAAEDEKIKLISNAEDRTRKQTEVAFTRQIEDLRKRLKEEKGLTEKAKKAISETIISLEEQKEKEISNLSKKEAIRRLEEEREVSDSRIALISDEFERRTAEIEAQYDRQADLYRQRLILEEGLTEEQTNRLNELILNTEKAKGNALSQLLIERLKKQGDLVLSETDSLLSRIDRKLSISVVRNDKGLELIDVQKTKTNLEELLDSLDTYEKGLDDYAKKARSSFEKEVSTLAEGSQEREEAELRYESVVDSTTQKIIEARRRRKDITKQLAELEMEAIRDMCEKVSIYTSGVVDALNSVFDTLSTGIQIQLDEMHTQLDALSEHYEKAKSDREKAADHVSDLEAQMRGAGEATRDALKEQIQDAMHARAEAEREELRLAREKEKKEEELKRKEKQLKRVDLLSQIAQGVANTALGVTRALTLGPIIGPIMAGVVGAMGAIQVATMTRQLTKLEDGGLINGPSHRNGGVPIPGTGIEVEGGEFVVNKKSFAYNAGLVRFINDTPRPLTLNDLINFFPGNPSPNTVAQMGGNREEEIIEAIKGINMRPVVSVQDINDAQERVTEVKDIAGW